MKILVLILLLAAAVFGQTQTQKLPKEFAIKYDKFKDETDVSFYDFGSSLLPSGTTTTVGFIHPGNTLQQDSKEFYLFFSKSGCSGFCFHDPSFILLIDGERVIVSNRSDVLSDSVLFFVDRSILSRIASAKLVEYQVGRFEGAWKEKNIAKFKTLLNLGTIKK